MLKYLSYSFLLSSLLFQSCGEKPKTKQEIERESRKNAVETLLEQAKINRENAKFDLNDETSACTKAAFFAEKRKVNLDSCSLKNKILEIAATNPENKLSHNESLDTTKPEDDLYNQVDSTDSNLSSFFDSMVYAISVSRG